MRLATVQPRFAVCLVVSVIAASAAACSGSQSAPVQPLPPPAPEQTVTAPPAAAAKPAEPSPEPPKPSTIEKAPYGKLADQTVDIYTLKNANGLLMKVATYGATVTELHVPDRDGKLDDIVLGFDTLEAYVKDSPFFGATIGRVANRIRNAKFTLEGKPYTVAANDKPHHLHGGKGWDKVVWTAEPVETPEGPQLRLVYVSKDGDEGYPGTVTARTIYTLTNDNTLRVEMEAVTDKTTIVNMAHHSYWNLAGHGSGTILDHELTLFADRYTPGDPMVPTGAVKPVQGTPFDFTQSKAIGKDLKAVGGKPIGYDHNFVVSGTPNAMRPVARVREPRSGRVMTLEADQPGVQFYSGNFLDGKPGKGGVKYLQYTGFCLETQKFPNAINVPAWAEQVILRPGTVYKHAMVHRFTAE